MRLKIGSCSRFAIDKWKSHPHLSEGLEPRCQRLSVYDVQGLWVLEQRERVYRRVGGREVRQLAGAATKTAVGILAPRKMIT
jgi:hypothetical protein